MSKIFNVSEPEIKATFEVTRCTAIAPRDMDLGSRRQDALFVASVIDGEKRESVCFGCSAVPETLDEFKELYLRDDKWDDSEDTLQTVRKIYYVADPEYADAIYGNQRPSCLDLAEVERLAKEWDMTTDELLAQMHEATAAEEAMVLTQEIYELAGKEFDIDSRNELASVLYDTLGLPPVMKDQKGYRVDNEALQLLSKYPIVAKILEYRAVK